MEKKSNKNESNEESASSSDSSQDSHSTVRSTYSRRRANDPNPPGLSGRIEKFSGRQGDADFELWVMDFNEATLNCGWDDVQRAKWFS